MRRQAQDDRPLIFKSGNALVKEKGLMEETLKELDRREDILVENLGSGPTLPFAEVYNQFRAIGLAREHLKEKVRLEDAGGKTAEEEG